MEYPRTWLERIRSQYPSDYKEFVQALDDPPPVSLRLHRRKGECRLPLSGPVPWAEKGRYVSGRPGFGADPLFHAGCYYVQEAGSMLIEPVFLQLGMSVGKRYILDCCAAPGGKSTHLASLMNGVSALLSNEVVRKRYQVLRENATKWGCKRHLLTQVRMESLAKLGDIFDLVLVDAPCSGEGLFRKDSSAIAEWSPSHAQSCSIRQRFILDHAVRLVRPGGYLLYSTCTFNPEENERNVGWMARQYGLESVPVKALEDHGCLAISYRDTISYQSLPHRVAGEGFFLSCLRKSGKEPMPAPAAGTGEFNEYRQPSPGDPLAEFIAPEWHDGLRYDQKQRMVYLEGATGSLAARLRDRRIPFRLPVLGERKRDAGIPSHFLAMSGMADPGIPRIELPVEQAVRYMRKETFPIPHHRRTWMLAVHRTVPLGWIKSIGPNRWNNYYPMHYRIRAGG